MGRKRRARPRARVLIVSGLSLFGEGIEGLLRQEPGLEIVGLETDPGQAIGRIREAHPDVVILTDGEAGTGLGAELLGMVREGFRMRIVEVHLASNTLCLYCGEQQSIREVRDVVDTLEHICDSLNREAQVPLSPAMGPHN
jgi:DNA-binding NarL/FixJ family response regulator